VAGRRARATIAGDGITGTAELREVDAQTAGGHDMKFMTGTRAVEITITVTGLPARTACTHARQGEAPAHRGRPLRSGPRRPGRP
jgi:hypothetical protein